MIVAYLAHQIGAVNPKDESDAKRQTEENIKDILKIVAVINRETTKIIPFVPYLSDVLSLNDAEPNDRQRGMNNGLEILKRGIVDQLWLTGPRISEGMKQEIYAVKGTGIKVINLAGVDISEWLKKFNY